MTIPILFILIISLCHPAQTASVVKGELGDKLDVAMNQFNREGYSGVILVVRNDEVVLRKGYGLANRELGIQNTPATVFHVASVGKIFTAAAILHLEMKGKLSTDDLIGKYLGAFPGDKSRTTIHNLLTHTAGLASSGAPLEYGSREAFVRSMKQATIDFTPGKNYRYSNAGYVLLAAIVEEVSGKPFEVYLQKNLFHPAGMLSTGYAWDAKFDNAPVAIGYEGDTVATSKPGARVTNVWGNRGPGNILTTVEDLYKWIRAIDSNSVLSSQAKKKMFSVYAHNDEGYGWHVVKTARGTRMVRRGGGRSDFESEVQWYTDEKVVVIFTVNNDLNFRRRVAPAIEQIVFR